MSTHDDLRDDLGNALAVIGFAGRFPGAADAEAFWHNLREGIASVTQFSEDEVLSAGADPEHVQQRRYVRAGAVLDDVDRFDAALFGFTPREARLLDPQHRHFLECGWTALEHAGIDPSQGDTAIGVFAGSFLNGYLLGHLAPRPEVLADAGWLATRILNDKDFLATRLSYLLDLRGPSLTIQTACSTSLVATHLAYQSLLNFDCDVALAGGVAIQVPQRLGYLYEEGGIFSPDGVCRAFDANARGTVGGSGVGLVVLKRAEDALADGDRIHALIRGTAINNDGALKAGYTAPSVESQAEVVAAAQSLAEIDPETIGYVEAHGTGTALGDPIEVEALSQVFGANTDRTGFCALGSVKTNIGHLDAAAGVAGLIKTVLALDHGELPPSLGCDTPSPVIGFERTPFTVNTALRPWPTGETPRRAGVSSFGVGGTNAHVVLEEAPPREASGPSRPWQLLPLSAATDSALDQRAQDLARHLEAHPELDLADVAHTLRIGRRALRHRRMVLARNTGEAIARLEEPGQPQVAERERPPVVFLIPGQGAQRAGMGAQLYRDEPTYRAAIDRCAKVLEPHLLEPHLGRDLREVLFDTSDSAAATLEDTALAQPALFVTAWATAQLWAEWGVEPRALLGHSLGEWVAATLAGVLDLDDALRVVATRGRLMGELAGGSMLSVGLDEAMVQAVLADPSAGSSLALAAVNGEALCAVSGDTSEIARLEQRLRGRGVEVRRLHTSHAFHSAAIEPMLEPFAELLRQVPLRAPARPIVSSLTGEYLSAEQATDPAYWIDQTRQTVRFDAGLTTLLNGQRDLLVLEVGPGRALSSLARRRGATALASLDPTGQGVTLPEDAHGDEHAALLNAVGTLWRHGVAIDWRGFEHHETRRREVLPTYPFADTRFWIERPASTPQRAADLPEGFAAVVDTPSTTSPRATASPQVAWLIRADQDPTVADLVDTLEATGTEITRWTLPADDPTDPLAGLLALREALTDWADTAATEPRQVVVTSASSDPTGRAGLQALAAWAQAAPDTGPTRRVVVVDPDAPPSPATWQRLLHDPDLGTALVVTAPTTTVDLDQPAAEVVTSSEAAKNPPRGALEHEVATLWSQLLGAPVHDRDGDFFALGGHSLLATQAVSRLRDRLAVHLELDDLFRSPTPALLAQRITALRGESDDAPEASETPAKPIDTPEAGPAPLSTAQRRFWLLDRLAPGDPAYNIPAAVRLRGRLDLDALGTALQALVTRHAQLRTVFTHDAEGEPVQQTLPALPDDQALVLERVDLRPLGDDPDAQTEALDRHLAEHARRSFDIAQLPLLRASLMQLADDHYVLSLALHHLVGDGWSMAVLVRDLGIVYGAGVDEIDRVDGIDRIDGTEPDLPALTARYTDLARQQNTWLASDAPSAQLDYWRERLEGELPVLDLPTDRPRRTTGGERPSERLGHTLDANHVDALTTLGQEEQATPFMALLAVFSLLLHRLGGLDDLVVGTPIAGRRERASEEVVGLFLNTLALRLDLAGAPTFRQLLAHVVETARGAYAHQDLPFERVLDHLDIDRDLGQTPVFQVFFNLLSYPLTTVERPELTLEPLPPQDVGAKFDLTLYASHTETSVRFDWIYDRDLFDAERIALMARQLDHLIQQVVSDPDRPIDRFDLRPPLTLALSLGGRGDQKASDTAAIEQVEGVAGANERKRSVPLPRDSEGHPATGVRPAPTEPTAAEGVGEGAEATPSAGPKPPAGTAEDNLAPLTLALSPGGRGDQKVGLPDPSQPLEGYEVPRISTTIREVARAHPDAVAVTQGSTTWTYAELLDRVDDLAAVVRGAGLGSGTRVVVAGTPSPAVVAASLAVLEADTVLVLLDPNQPDDRVRAMLEIAEVRAVVWADLNPVPEAFSGVLTLRVDTDGRTEADASRVPATQSSDTASPENDAAYVFFTSGSTGRPKAILGNHRGLGHFFTWQREAFAVGPGDRMAQLTALGFDPVLRDLLLPLSSGATVVLPERADRVSGTALWQWLDQQRITLMQTVPSLLESWLEDLADGADAPALADLRILFSMGEALTGALVDRFRQRFPDASGRVINLYGPTETTLARCWFDVPDPAPPGVQPLGWTLPDSQALVISPAGTLCGIGEPGEIVLRTPFRSSGYLDAPEADWARFAPNPWRADAAEQEDLLFHTGDRGRYGLDGRLEFLGRLDRQIKIRGVRVEPTAVREVLLDAPGVAQGTVRTVRDNHDRPRLVAYVVPTADTRVDQAVLRAHLARQLPPAAVPDQFVELEALPRTHSGKIDQRQLPEPEPLASTDTPFRAPSTPQEQRLAALWEELLGDGPYGLDDDFFVRGGNSLSAVQLGARLATRHGIDIPLRTVFENPTLGALASTLDEFGTSEDHDEVRGEANDRSLPVAQADAHGGYALSFAQHRLWFLDQLAPGLPAYNIPTAWRLRGPLEIAALEAAFAAVVARHDTLRTRFDAPEGKAVQVIEPSVDCPLPVETVEGDATLAERLTAEARTPFDLTQPPLLRARLFQRADDDHVLALTLHHIVGDAWSVALLLGELGEHYAAHRDGRAPNLPELTTRYVDVAHGQRQHLVGDRLERQVDYWRQQLEGAPAALALPGDRPRPAVQSLAGARLPFRLDARELPGLEALARAEAATPFALLLAVFQTVLQRASGQDDFVVGTPVANRERPEVEPLIGLFLNTLPLRSRVSDAPTLRQATRRLQADALAAYEHQELPFEKLVDELDIPREASHSPVFQVLFTLHNTPLPEIDLGELELGPHPLDHQGAKLDLTLDLRLLDGALEGSLEIATALFNRVTGERWITHFGNLLRAALADPDTPLVDLPMLAPAERQQVLDGWNATEAPLLTTDLWQRFATNAKHQGEATAMLAGDRSWTYAALLDAAERLAHQLVDAGAHRGRRVGVLLDRSPELVVTLLAVLRTGAAYIPLDPGYPAARLAMMVEDGLGGDTTPGLLVTTKEHAQAAPEGPHTLRVIDPLTEPEDTGARASETPSAALTTPEPDTLDPDGLAYIIYTSGSTGRPKGVAIPHRGMVNFLAAMAERPGLTADDRLLAVTSPSFDIAVLELFLPMWVGASVEIADRATAGDALALGRRLDDPAVTVAQATPSTWRMLVDIGWRPRRDLRVLTGGEALPQDLATALCSAGGTVWNLYGPTETTVWSTIDRVDTTVTLGTPIANTQVRVLDRRFRPVAIGAPGEVLLGGAGLARGYHQRPALTAERFVPDPFASTPGARLYRVGDLARWRADGKLLYLGRTDHQVKIRGFRIELGEIDSVLGQHPELGEVVVHAVDAPGGGQRLVAWVTPAPQDDTATPAVETLPSDALPSVDSLRAWLGERLPGHMVPSLFVPLATLPKTPNGKIDRKALEVPDGERPDFDHAYVAPQGQAEETLATVWSTLLGVEQVGSLDSFFALGGDSILAVQMVFQAREAGYEVATAQVFQHQTLGELAAVAKPLDDGDAAANVTSGATDGGRTGSNDLADSDDQAGGDDLTDSDDDLADFGWSADELDGILEKL